MSRVIGVAVGVLILGGVAWAVVVGSPAVTVDCALVTREDISAYVSEQAKTQLPRVQKITMPLTGRIEPVTLQVGESVSAGDVVAELNADDLASAVAEGDARVARLEQRIIENDDTRLEVNALEQFDEYLKSMTATVTAAQTQTEASQAKLSYTRQEFGRKQTLAENNTVTESELAEAELSLKQAQVDYSKDMLTYRAMQSIQSAMVIGRASIEKYIEKKDLSKAVLEAELREARATLTRLQRDLGRAKIIATADGVVLHRHVTNQRPLNAGELLLEIGDLSELEVVVEILTQDAISLRNGLRAEVTGLTIDGTPLTGKVVRISPQGFTKVSSLGVEQQRVDVTIRLDPQKLQTLLNSGNVLGVDYRVRARIITDSSAAALTLPRSALFRGTETAWQVYVVRDGRAQRVTVEVGIMNDFRAEILGGVSDREPVLLAPPVNFTDGTKVAPRIIESTQEDE